MQASSTVKWDQDGLNCPGWPECPHKPSHLVPLSPTQEDLDNQALTLKWRDENGKELIGDFRYLGRSESLEYHVLEPLDGATLKAIREIYSAEDLLYVADSEVLSVEQKV